MITSKNIVENQNNDICVVECPICLEEFNNNNHDIIIVDCCNKKFHIKCIVTWYSYNINNKFCLMCNQTNSFCNNLLSDVSYVAGDRTNFDFFDNPDLSEIDISDNIGIDISNQYDDNVGHIQIYQNDLPIYLYNRNTIHKCKICIVLSISIVIFTISIYYITCFFLYGI
jgi:hypothetical protein